MAFKKPQYRGLCSIQKQPSDTACQRVCTGIDSLIYSIFLNNEKRNLLLKFHST